MLILTHVIVALAGLFLSGLGVIKPSKQTLKLAYAAVAATFASGTLLIITSQAHLKQTCLSGLIYLAVTLPLLAYGRKQAIQKI